MHVATTILLLLFVTAFSLMLSRVVRLPLPLLQIALGVAASLLGVQVHFEPDVFLLLFIPPLLFADAYLMPTREFRSVGRVVLMLALGLVLFTTIGGGYVVHWLVPPVPLAACFALAAVLAPTDAVAVGGMIEGRPVPHRFMHILSGEALLNDASGLVCFKFAAAAAMTGSFSAGAAAGAFLLVSCAGFAVGAVLAGAVGLVETLLIRRGFDESVAFVTISALLPFASYLAAEHVGASGILAAVAAGLTLKQMRVFDSGRSDIRLRATAVWGVLTFSFNGLIFLLLGLQLPALLRDGIASARAAGASAWRLLLTVMLITLTLVLLRLVWIAASLLLQRTVHRLRATAPPTRPAGRLVLALAVAGVKGAITLAAVLSLAPDFPERDVLVTLAAGVIVASLLLAAVALPPLLHRLELPAIDPMELEAVRARLAIAQVAVEATERELSLPDEDPQNREHREAMLAQMLVAFQDRERRLSAALQVHGSPDASPELDRDRLETAFRLRILRIEREALTRMSRASEINDQTERLLARELDHQEEVLSAVARSLPWQTGPGAGHPA